MYPTEFLMYLKDTNYRLYTLLSMDMLHDDELDEIAEIYEAWSN